MRLTNTDKYFSGIMIGNMTDLEKSILSTLAYYDILDRPLTGWEVFRYLVHNPKLSRKLRSATPKCLGVALLSVLDVLENIELVSQKNGLYFLKGRDEIVKQRIERQKIADRKWKKAKRVIKALQALPYIRMVAVSGSLAMNNTKENSDIDLLIVTKAGRIWTCRALTTLYFHIIKQRRHGKLTKNRFCLNHFITDKSLKIPWKSLYNAQTYAHLVPLWQKRGLYPKFQKANNWISQRLNNYPVSQKGYLNIVNDNRLLELVRKSRELILDNQLGDGIESLLKRFQTKRIKKDPLTLKSGGRVSFDDSQLEFHPDSPEKEILKKYNQKMRELGLEELANERDSGLTI